MSGYVRRLWLGDVAVSRVFWRDMLVVGTLVNLAAMTLALLLFGLSAPTALAAIVYFSPVPYNILLFMGVWQSAGSEPPQAAWPIRAVALAWLVAAILI